MRTKQLIVATAYDKRGKVIAVATNSYTQTHPLQKRLAEFVGRPEKIYLHAEIKCIIRSKNKKIHKIKIERFGAKGEKICSKPCPICELAIQEAKIRYVEYTP